MTKEYKININGDDITYGIVEVENGDYIIKYPNGDLYACKPNLFNMKKEDYTSVTY